MKSEKLNILILYSCSEFPFRKTFKAYLNSFSKYSSHNYVYINYPYLFPKILLRNTTWDIVIFTYSFTTPWNRKSFEKKLDLLKNLNLKTAYKIAFFQDEYINTDLTQKFIIDNSIDKVFTVVPESEWSKVYPLIDRKKIKKYLTGYIEDEDVELANAFLKNYPKDIDISYRTAYPGSAMASFGRIGWLKYDISNFGLTLNLPKADIKVGEGFVTGDGWYKLLARSKFVLGVPSGTNILDVDGSIASLSRNFKFGSFEELNKLYAENNIVQDYKLEVISPRNFEASLFECIQILVEGDYNDIFKPDIHYIPVNRELSNAQDVMSKIRDREYCLRIQANIRKDIVNNPEYRYSYFIEKVVYENVQITTSGKRNLIRTCLARRLSQFLYWTHIIAKNCAKHNKLITSKIFEKVILFKKYPL